LQRSGVNSFHLLRRRCSSELTSIEKILADAESTPNVKKRVKSIDKLKYNYCC
jgi:hypothetical protein